MLENLHIRNLALVTELDMEYGPGLNIVTGETGAGKSLIIGAVQLLAGSRATPAVIRKGAKSCEVAGGIRLTGEYAPLCRRIDARLEEAGLPVCEEGRLLVRRVITESGSRAYVNGSMVTAGFLKELCDNLIDLHGPHDNQTLFQTQHQLELLDTYAGLGDKVQGVGKVYAELSRIRQERAELKSAGLTPEEAGLLEFQLKEIDKAALRADEEEELVKAYRLASNSKRLIEDAYAAQGALSEGESSIADQLGNQLRMLHELAQMDPQRGGDLVGRLEEVAETLRELADDFGDYASSLDIDQEELARMEGRLDLIQKLKRKYGATVAEVLETGERIRARLESIRGREGHLAELERREAECLEVYQGLCRDLSRRRREAAPRLAKAIQDKLHSLDFLRAAFAVTLHEVSGGSTGTDGVEFCFAANVGEDLQPLRQVASSGEIARVMLAVKTVLSDVDSVPILIFDEIDANVGGRVAVSVAAELRAVGRRHQVFSITHMPQIAAAGRQHFLVAKSVSGDRTVTGMRQIEGDERLAEIVRMMGADPKSAAALAHAKELLDEAN